MKHFVDFLPLEPPTALTKRFRCNAKMAVILSQMVVATEKKKLGRLEKNYIAQKQFCFVRNGLRNF